MRQCLLHNVCQGMLRKDFTHQPLEGRVQLAAGVLQHHADGPVGAIALENRVHDVLSLVLVCLVGVVGSQLLFNHAHAHDLVSIVDQLVEQPLQRIIGIGVLVHADHECARSPLGLIPLVSNIQRQRQRVVLGRFAQREIVECDMRLEPVRHGGLR